LGLVLGRSYLALSTGEMGNRCAPLKFGVDSNPDTAPATVNKNVWF
jgi:hypothetical protein